MKHLKRINLSRNEIGSTGIQAVGEMLKINKTLIKLKLSYNLIACEDTIPIMEGLKVNKLSRELVMTDEKIEDEDIDEMVKVNKTPTELNVNDNKISCMRDLVKALRSILYLRT